MEGFTVVKIHNAALGLLIIVHWILSGKTNMSFTQRIRYYQLVCHCWPNLLSAYIRAVVRQSLKPGGFPGSLRMRENSGTLV